jgi:hypothetical protein
MACHTLHGEQASYSERPALMLRPPTLLLAFEPGGNTWQLGFTTDSAQRPRERQGPAGDGHLVLEELRWAKQRFGLPENARGVRCYEAGRGGVWLPRLLIRHGIENSGVDSVRIEVNRCYRQANMDRLDVPPRLTRLPRYMARECKVWRVGRVPRVAEEDRRHLHRELLTAKRDRT